MDIEDNKVSVVSTIQETMPSLSTSPPARQNADWESGAQTVMPPLESIHTISDDFQYTGSEYPTSLIVASFSPHTNKILRQPITAFLVVMHIMEEWLCQHGHETAAIY